MVREVTIAAIHPKNQTEWSQQECNGPLLNVPTSTEPSSPIFDQDFVCPQRTNWDAAKGNKVREMFLAIGITI